MSSKFKAHFIAGLKTSSIPKLKLLAEKMAKNTVNFEVLEFRSLQLTLEELVLILNLINSFKEPFSLSSLSFSFNPYFGNEAATVLANKLPNTLENLGLVGCNISDKGAEAILKWIKKTTPLKMICIENNPISSATKQKYYSHFKKYPTKILVI